MFGRGVESQDVRGRSISGLVKAPHQALALSGRTRLSRDQRLIATTIAFLRGRTGRRERQVHHVNVRASNQR